MALKFLNERSPSLRSWATLALSTNADGITGADIVDLGGLFLAGLQLSASSTDANYSFRGAIDSTASLQTLLNSSGDVVTIGSTAAGASSGKTFIFDPSKFTGIRFLQIFSGTSAAAIANATGATVTVLAGVSGQNR